MDIDELTEQRLRAQIAAMMDAGVAAQDGHIQASLARARRAAQAQPKRSWAAWLQPWFKWNFGGAAAALALALLVVLILPGQRVDGPQAGSEIELAVAIDDPEFFQDLGFYYWLEEQEGSSEL